MRRHLHEATVLLVTVAVVLFAVPAAAQDGGGTMTFGEEEAKEAQEGGDEQDEKKETGDQSGDSGGSDDGTMTFGTDEAKEATDTTTKVGVVVVPVEELSAKQQDTLGSRLDKALEIVREKKDKLKLDTSDKTLAALKKRTVATCVTEPLCLASVGRKAGVDRILLAKADEDGGTWSLDLDYFDVENTLFLKYHSIEDKSSFKSTLGGLKTGVREVFDIRMPRQGPDYYSGSSSKALRIIGISSGVLSLGALTTGLVMGNQSQSLQNEIAGADRFENGVYRDLSQQEAKETYNKAQTRALTANVLFGLSAGFAVTSGILLATNWPQGESAGGGQASLFERIRLTPRVGANSAGIGASVDF